MAMKNEQFERLAKRAQELEIEAAYRRANPPFVTSTAPSGVGTGPLMWYGGSRTTSTSATTAETHAVITTWDEYGAPPHAPITKKDFEILEEKRFRATAKVDRHSFSMLDEAGRKEIAAKLALEVAHQLVKEYVGCLEHPHDRSLEFGIDIRVRG